MPEDTLTMDYVILIAQQEQLLIMLIILVLHAIRHVKHVYNTRANAYHVKLVHSSQITYVNQVVKLVNSITMAYVKLVRFHVHHALELHQSVSHVQSVNIYLKEIVTIVAQFHWFLANVLIYVLTDIIHLHQIVVLNVMINVKLVKIVPIIV